jgi:hypothetical protein
MGIKKTIYGIMRGIGLTLGCVAPQIGSYNWKIYEKLIAGSYDNIRRKELGFVIIN